MPLHTTHILRLADLSARKTTRLLFEPESEARAAMAEELGLSELRKLRLEGTLTPMGKSDWRLTAHLGATVVQPCVVTLEPVVTRIEEPLERQYVSDYQDPEGAEVEMPEDDTTEPLPAAIDLAALAAEALALAVPAYPRADGAEAPEAVFAPPGVTPLRDADLNPFAGLAGLKDKLAKGD